MDTRTIILLVALVVAVASLTRIRLMFMLKGKKINGVVKDYISPQGSFIPIMEFEYEGQLMTMKAKNGFKNKKYEIGTEIEIYYIPGYDKEVKIMSDYTDIFYLVVFLVLGIVMVVCSLLQ